PAPAGGGWPRPAARPRRAGGTARAPRRWRRRCGARRAPRAGRPRPPSPDRATAPGRRLRTRTAAWKRLDSFRSRGYAHRTYGARWSLAIDGAVPRLDAAKLTQF